MIISVFDFIFVIMESFFIAEFYNMFLGLKDESPKNTCLFFVLFAIEDVILSHLNFSNIIQMSINVATFFILLLIFTYGSIMEKMMLSLFINAVIMSSSYLSIITISKVYNVSFYETVSNNGIIKISLLIFSKMILFILLFFFINIKKRIIPALKKEEELLLAVVAAISLIIEFFLRKYLLIDGKKYFAFFTTTIAMLLLNIIIYYFIIIISKKNEETAELIEAKFLLKQQEINYKNIEENYRESLKIRHDFKNQISCALSLAEKNQIEELKCYLKKFSNEIGDVKTYVVTKNNILNTIINSKFSKAEKNNIDVKCIVDNNIKFSSDIDLCTILSNLLDNAIEACERCDRESFVTLNISKFEDEIVVIIRNPTDEDILKKNPDLNTSKKDKKYHGIGISSVKSVLSKYNGNLEYEIKNGIFITKVVLKDFKS